MNSIFVGFRHKTHALASMLFLSLFVGTCVSCLSQIFLLVGGHSTNQAMLTTFDSYNDHLLLVITDQAGYNGKTPPILLIYTLHEYFFVLNTFLDCYCTSVEVTWEEFNDYHRLTFQYGPQRIMPYLSLMFTRSHYGDKFNK